jgi:MFS transporter, DHA1 family, multidrug resistance protein
VAVVLGCLFVVIGMTGLLGANCVGLLMARYPQNAGAAAALFVAGQFGFGMLASAGVSYCHDGTGRPMASAIVATSAASLLGYLLFRRTSRIQS